MHEHDSRGHTHDDATDGAEFAPGFPGRVDRFAGSPRIRGGRRGRGRGEGFGPGFGRGIGFGPGFGRGPKVGRGDVRAAILALLAEEPMHGYQIITELTDRSGGVWQPSPGSVYPTLQALEDQGLVTADKAEGKRVFSLTDQGRTEAEAAADGPAPWEDVARDADTGVQGLRGLMVQVLKATQQVAHAGTNQQIATVAGILTETRRKIYLVLADEAPAGTDGSTRAGS